MCPRCNGYTYIDETRAPTCTVCGWRDHAADNGDPSTSRPSQLGAIPRRGTIVRFRGRIRSRRTAT
jgi:hypothetical protein